MIQIKTIEVNYQSNYNGCYLYCAELDVSLEDVEDESVVEKAKLCISDIVDHAVDDCDDNGMYMGSINKLREFAFGVVREHFGPDVELTFVVDSIST